MSSTIAPPDPQRGFSKEQISLDLYNVASAAKADIEASQANVSTLQTYAKIVVEEWTNPAAAVVDAIKHSVATVHSSAQTYTGSALDGAVGTAVMSPPRNPTVTTGGTVAGSVSVTNVTFTGLDISGNALTEDVAITAVGGAATFVGGKCFASVSSIHVPIQAGTAATLKFGFGSILGLAIPIKNRGGVPNTIQSIEGGSFGINGMFADTTTSPPNGSFAPGTAPDGATSYALTYERQ